MDEPDSPVPIVIITFSADAVAHGKSGAEFPGIRRK
jgi:hypothetical protein